MKTVKPIFITARLSYPVRLKADAGGYVVTCRDLPSLITQGNDKDEALHNAADAMDEVFTTYMIQGLAFPEPSTVKRGEHMVVPPVETIAKAASYQAMLDVGVRLLPQGEVDLEKRSRAVAQSCSAKPSPKGQSGRDFLAQARVRHMR